VERTSEPVTSASSFVSEANIRKICDVLQHVKEQKLEEALGDPSGYSVGTKHASKYAHLDLELWQPKRMGEILNKVSLTSVLKEVIESSAEPLTLANGFTVCELCPLNPNALDYTKCLGASASAGNPNEHSKKTEKKVEIATNYSTFITIS
jgi:hypothetical protein